MRSSRRGLCEARAAAQQGWHAISRVKPIGEGTFHRWWERCLDAAGVRYRNAHVARHTFATRWLRRGGRMETLRRRWAMPRLPQRSTCTAMSTSPTWRATSRSSRASQSIKSKVRIYDGRRRGPDSNRCTRLCRPLPNLSATAPRASHRTGRQSRLGRKRLTCAEWTHAASCEPCPGVDGARCGWSPGPLPGLRYGYEERANPDYAVTGANRRPARRRAVARARRSARRPTASSAASSPLRARRRRSRWRSRS